jgi:SAM-dependent methyltransferase
MELVNCDYCGENSTTHVVSQTDILHHTTQVYFSIVECNNCKLNYLNPRPTPQEIHQYYNSSYSFHEDKSLIKVIISKFLDFIANSWPVYFFIFSPKRIQKILSQRIRPLLPDPILNAVKAKQGMKVLDIGCGSGIHAHYWGSSGSVVHYSKFSDAFGVDISENARKILNQNSIKSFKDIDELEEYCLKNKITFNFIRMNWSLEHVYEPSKYFNFINKFLNKDGTSIICIPNFDGFIYRLAKDLVEVPIHLYHFKIKDIENYAKKYQLNIKNHQTISYPAMFLHAGEVYKKFNAFNELNLLDCIRLKNFLKVIDQAKLGSDLIITLNKN